MQYRDFNKISWSPIEEQIIYREWGVFFSKKKKLDVADFYYNKSLKLNPNDAKALCNRSRCKREIAETEGGVADAEKALGLAATAHQINLEVCDGLYELNKFEKTTMRLINSSRKFTGKMVLPFEHRLDVLCTDFDYIFGDPLESFIMKNERYFYKAKEEMISEQAIDERPLWKILKEKNKCDCLSVILKEIVLLPPREIARRLRAFDIFNQIYMGKSWIDILFLRTLKKHEGLLLPQALRSRPYCAKLTKVSYRALTKIVKRLNCRCPLYTKNVLNCPDEDLRLKHIEDGLYRIQNQVRRSVFKMLDRLRALKKSGNIRKLRLVIEEIMGDYLVLKTHRTMPWKFRFINEVYNIFGLALLEKLLTIPPELQRCKPRDRLRVILKLRGENVQDIVPFVFGDRSTHRNINEVDKSIVRLKAMEARLRKRLIFVTTDIQKTYLYHELAMINFNLGQYDKCIRISHLCNKHAEHCRNKLWTFLASMLYVKTNLMMGKIERVSEALVDVKKIARKLKSPAIKDFIEKCVTYNTDDLNFKKEQDRSRRAQSLMSILSKGSLSGGKHSSIGSSSLDC